MDLIIGSIIGIVGIYLGSKLSFWSDRENYKRDRLEHFGLHIGELQNRRRKFQESTIGILKSLLPYAQDVIQLEKESSQLITNLSNLEKDENPSEEKQKQLQDSKKQIEEHKRRLKEIKNKLDTEFDKVKALYKHVDELNDQTSVVHTMSLLHGSEHTKFIDDYVRTTSKYYKEIYEMIAEIGSLDENKVLASSVNIPKIIKLYKKSDSELDILLKNLASDIHKKSILDKLHIW